MKGREHMFKFFNSKNKEIRYGLRGVVHKRKPKTNKQDDSEPVGIITYRSTIKMKKKYGI